METLGNGQKELLEPLEKAAKKTKIVSIGASLVPDKRVQAFGKAAAQLGYGKKGMSNAVVKARASDLR